MKASEVIARLQELMEQEGDLEVGFFDFDHNSFVYIDTVATKDANREHWDTDLHDSEELGAIFFAIE